MSVAAGVCACYLCNPMVIAAAQDYENYPEFPAANRIKLALDWIPPGTRRLLDAGCSFGYATRLFSERAGETCGMDIDPEFVAIASGRYPDIGFVCSPLEHTPFGDAGFDTIVMSDVFEHVDDEHATLNELYRILAPGGTLIITTPHSGLFTLLDPYNYGYYLRRYAPLLFALLKNRSLDARGIEAGYKHRHYSLRDFQRLLDSSDFQGRYSIDKVFRSGFLLHPLELNAAFLLEKVLSAKTTRAIIKPLSWLSEAEYWLPFGPLAYNIALQIRKSA